MEHFVNLAENSESGLCLIRRSVAGFSAAKRIIWRVCLQIATWFVSLNKKNSMLDISYFCCLKYKPINCHGQKFFPRFHEENIKKNKRLYDEFEKCAQRHGCTPPQLALAWVIHQGGDVAPIPGE